MPEFINNVKMNKATLYLSCLQDYISHTLQYICLPSIYELTKNMNKIFNEYLSFFFIFLICKYTMKYGIKTHLPLKLQLISYEKMQRHHVICLIFLTQNA